MSEEDKEDKEEKKDKEDKEDKEDWHTLIQDNNNFSQEVPFDFKKISEKLKNASTSPDKLNPYYTISAIYDFTKFFNSISSALSMGFSDITEKCGIMREKFKQYPESTDIQNLLEIEMRKNLDKLNKDNNNELILGQKSAEIVKKKENEMQRSEKRSIKYNLKDSENNKKVNKNNQLQSNDDVSKINVKKQLFRFRVNHKQEENKINNKIVENEITFNKSEKKNENKLNKISSFKQNKEDILVKKFSSNEKYNKFQNKNSKSITPFNEKEENNNKNQRIILNHCVLNNVGLRKIYKDSYNKKIEKEKLELKDYNNQKEDDEISIGNKKSNNKNNSNIRKIENLYASTSMKMIKSGIYKKKNDEKQQYNSNTYKKNKSNEVEIIYEGDKIDKKANGKGTLYYKNYTIKYQGDFIDGKFNGLGKYNFENGDCYIGKFKYGLREGKRGFLNQ